MAPEWPAEFPGVVPDRVTARTRGRQHRAQPAAHRFDRGRADDRARARDARRDACGRIVQSFTSAVDDIFTGDYSITAQNNFDPIPISAAEAAAKAPGVIAVGSVRTGDARVFRKTIFATAVDPGAKDVITLTWVKGSQQTLGESRGGRRVRRRRLREAARARRRLAGRVTFLNGAKKRFVVKGIFDPPPGGYAVRAGHDLGRDLGREQLATRRTSTRS